MSFDQGVILASIILSGTAIVVNVYAALTGSPRLRPIYWVIAILYAPYFGSYFWLIRNLGRSGEWSHWLRPVGMVQIGGIGILHTMATLAHYRYRQRQGREMQKLADALKEAAGGE